MATKRRRGNRGGRKRRESIARAVEAAREAYRQDPGLTVGACETPTEHNFERHTILEDGPNGKRMPHSQASIEALVRNATVVTNVHGPEPEPAPTREDRREASLDAYARERISEAFAWETGETKRRERDRNARASATKWANRADAATENRWNK